MYFLHSFYNFMIIISACQWEKKTFLFNTFFSAEQQSLRIALLSFLMLIAYLYSILPSNIK